MPNAMYDRCKKGLPSAEIDWVGGTIKALALDATYVFSASDLALSDVTGAAILDTVTVPDCTVNDQGEWFCGDLSPGPTIGASDEFTQLVMYLDSGVASTSWLMLYFDTNSDLTPIYRVGVGDPVLVPFPNAVVSYV